MNDKYKALGLNKAECLANKCFVCQHTGLLEQHHVIMRAHGGQNWPTVNLCADCHSFIHLLAQEVESDINHKGYTLNDSFCRILAKYDPKKISLTYVKKLITILLAAKSIIQQDLNKTLMFQDRFPADIANKLRCLVALHGGSQRSIVRIAIDQMYGRYFT